MSAYGFHFTRSNSIAFLLGLSVSVALTMCSDLGAGPSGTTTVEQAEFDALVDRVAVLEAAENGTDVVYLRDVKASGIDGGTCPTGAWQTRDLNTLDDPFGVDWVTAPSSNQFTLSAGTYAIDGACPAWNASRHKCRLRNVTDSTDAIAGTVSSNATGNTAITSSLLRGIVSVTAATVFQVQHWCNSGSVDTGFGQALGIGVDEVYTTLKVKRLSD